MQGWCRAQGGRHDGRDPRAGGRDEMRQSAEDHAQGGRSQSGGMIEAKSREARGREEA